MRYATAFAAIAVSAIVLAFGSGGRAAAETLTSPEKAAHFVETMGNRAVTLLAKGKNGQPQVQQAALRDLLRNSFNLELTSQFVLGKSWHEATAAQRAEFQDLFTEYLLNTYIRHLATYKAETLTVVGSQVVGDEDVLVETSIRSVEGETYPVWRVRAGEDGHYKIIDVSVDGVSLALTQRREFAAVVNRHGLAGLLAMLREKLAAQAKSAQWAPNRDQAHHSLLASMLASPNANRIGIVLATR